MKKDKEYVDIRETFNCFRNLQLNEEEAEKTRKNDNADDADAVPYSQQDELMSSIMQTAKSQFGADFTNAKTPMLYYPKDGDVTLSGEIPGLGGDIKFQFKYKDASGNGCFIWCNYMVLSDETVKKLSVINGVYKNWKEELSTAEDIKPMAYGGDSQKQMPQQDQNDQTQGGLGMQPGDDMPQGQMPQQGMPMMEGKQYNGIKRGDDID